MGLGIEVEFESSGCICSGYMLKSIIFDEYVHSIDTVSTMKFVLAEGGWKRAPLTDSFIVVRWGVGLLCFPCLCFSRRLCSVI